MLNAFAQIELAVKSTSGGGAENERVHPPWLVFHNPFGNEAGKSHFAPLVHRGQNFKAKSLAERKRLPLTNTQRAARYKCTGCIPSVPPEKGTNYKCSRIDLSRNVGLKLSMQLYFRLKWRNFVANKLMEFLESRSMLYSCLFLSLHRRELENSSAPTLGFPHCSTLLFLFNT